LSDPALKQQICGKIVGVSHRDVEKALRDIVNSKATQDEQQETEEVEEFQPEAQPRKVERIKMEYLLDQDEINKLIEESTAAYVDKPSTTSKQTYPTFTQEEARALITPVVAPALAKGKKKK